MTILFVKSYNKTKYGNIKLADLLHGVFTKEPKDETEDLSNIGVEALRVMGKIAKLVQCLKNVVDFNRAGFRHRRGFTEQCVVYF